MGNLLGQDADQKDGLTQDRLDQIERYREMSDEDRTKYELKWADAHGLGWRKDSMDQWNSRDLMRNYGGVGRGNRENFDYNRMYEDIPVPNWMRREREQLTSSGQDLREFVPARFAGGLDRGWHDMQSNQATGHRWPHKPGRSWNR